MTLSPGDTATVRSTGSPVTILATSTLYALVRNRFGGQWNYRLDELECAPFGGVCPI